MSSLWVGKTNQRQAEPLLYPSSTEREQAWLYLQLHLRQVELEVELPRRRARRIIPILVHEGEAQLDDLQKVHVAPEQLVLVVHRAAKLTDGSHHHPGELCVLGEERHSRTILPSEHVTNKARLTPRGRGAHYHSDIVVALNDLADLPHLLLHVARPDFTDDLTGILKCCWHVGGSGEELKSQQSCSVQRGGDGGK